MTGRRAQVFPTANTSRCNLRRRTVLCTHMWRANAGMSTPQCRLKVGASELSTRSDRNSWHAKVRVYGMLALTVPCSCSTTVTPHPSPHQLPPISIPSSSAARNMKPLIFASGARSMASDPDMSFLSASAPAFNSSTAVSPWPSAIA